MSVRVLDQARLLIVVWVVSTFVTWSLASTRGFAELVQVKSQEGATHGFLVLRSPDNKVIADGDLLQTAHGNRVTSRLLFRFKDGSVSDETTVFTQGQQFHLVTDRLVQKGPSFPQPSETSIDMASGKVTVQYTDDSGERRTEAETMKLPPDLANGMIQTLLKNVDAVHLVKGWPYLATTPKPQLVKLVLSVAGSDKFTTDGLTREATHYAMKIDIGGIKGLLAPLVGKQPPDVHVWISKGEVPAFVRAQQSFYVGGPVWQIELSSPRWKP